jgi:hypothetical protein
MLDERGLERVELATLGKALDGHDLCTFRLDREHGAGLHRAAVDIDRAGAAVTGLAADMGALQAQLLAQEMD